MSAMYIFQDVNTICWGKICINYLLYNVYIQNIGMAQDMKMRYEYKICRHQYGYV